MKQAQLFSSWKEIIEYDGNGPKRKELRSTPAFKTVLVGFEAGQKIDPHPAPEASYHFLEGSGWMIADGKRITVTTGATVVVPAGISRGIEAGSRLAVLASHPVSRMKHSNLLTFKRMGSGEDQPGARSPGGAPLRRAAARLRGSTQLR